MVITGNTFSGGPTSNAVLFIDRMDGTEVIGGEEDADKNTFEIDSPYALFEGIGTLDIDEIFNANTWKEGYSPVQGVGNGKVADVTAPIVTSAKAIGDTGFNDVDAVEMTITVDQGYMVKNIIINLNEAVTMVSGTKVSLDGVVYGNLKVDKTGKILTITPSGQNGVASKIGEFDFTIPAESVKDLAGNPLETLGLKLIVLNVAPEAVDDTYKTNEDTDLTRKTAVGVLKNDKDYDKAILTAEWVSGPENGELTLAEDGGFVYTPNANFNGKDTFTYKAYDGLDYSNIATVTINVVAVNDAPVLEEIEDATIPEMELFTYEVIATDVDEDDVLTFSLLSAPSNATIAPKTGEFSWTPREDQGPASRLIKVHVCDDAASPECDTKEFTLKVEEVNLPPVLQEIGNQEIVAGKKSEFYAIATDPDLPANSLIFSLVGAPEGMEIVPTGGGITWTPTDEDEGDYTFDVCVTDGTETVCETITVTVKVRNTLDIEIDSARSFEYDPPYTAVGVSEFNDFSNIFTTTYTTAQFWAALPEPMNDLTHYLGALYRQADATITSIEFDEITYTWDENGTRPSNWVDGSGNTLVSAIFAKFQAESLPTPKSWASEDGHTITVHDDLGHTANATFKIIVNDAPVAKGWAQTTAEDTEKEINLDVSDFNVDPLTIVIVDGPFNGELTVIEGNKVSYKPNQDYNGPDSFTFKATDGYAESNEVEETITVTPVNDAPVAQNQTVITDEETAIEITLVATDVDLDPLTYSIVTPPQHGSLGLIDGDKVTYTPTEDYIGTDSFIFKANDTLLDSLPASVIITVNDVPVAEAQTVETDEDTALAITLVASDGDFDPLTYEIVDGPANGTLSVIVGDQVTYTPAENYNGPDSFTFVAKDGKTDSNVAEITIDVIAVNDAPVAQDQAVETAEDTLIPISLLATDVDSTDLTYHIVTGPAKGTLSAVTGNMVIYTPEANFNGTVTFTFKANDGSADSLPATVTITVNETVQPEPVYTIFLPLIIK